MATGWQATHGALRAFMAEHPDIKVSTGVVSIPAEVRAGFYWLFDNTCRALIEEAFPEHLAEAKAQGISCKQAKAELSQTLARPVEVEPGLDEFLSEPLKHTADLLSDQLFKLLQDRQDTDAFAENSKNIAAKALEGLLGRGYIDWTALSLLNLLEPDEAYVVPLSNQIIDDCTSDVAIPGLGLEEVPDAVRAERIHLDVTLNQPFLAPKLIVHSPRFKAFFSLANEFRDVPLNARSRPNSLEWRRLPGLRQVMGSGRLWPDLAIYMAGSANELRLVADAFNIARPAVILECLLPFQRSSDRLEQIKRRARALEPAIGAFVACSQPSPDEVCLALRADAESTVKIEVITTRYEQPNLLPVVQAMGAPQPDA